MDVKIVSYDESRDKQVSFLLDIPSSEGHSSEAVSKQLKDILDNNPGLKHVTVGMSTDNTKNASKVAEVLEDSNLFGPQYLGHIEGLLYNINIMNTCFFEPEMQNEYQEISKHHISDLNKAHLKRKTYYINNALDEFLERCKFDREDESCSISQREMFSIQQQDLLMDSFFTGLILSKGDTDSNDEPSNFINYLCGFDIVSRNDDIFFQIINNSTKLDHFNNLVSERYKGKKEINLGLFFETKWLLALKNLRHLVELKNILLDPSFVSDVGISFTENDFTIISYILSVLEPFSVLCTLLTYDECTLKYFIPLLNKYEAIMSDVIGDPVEETSILARPQGLLRKFTNKVRNYLGNYKRNNICCVATLLTLGFSNNQFWVQKYASNNTDRYAQSNYVCEMISYEITEYIPPYLNITVVDPSPSETGETDSRYEHFKKFYGHENRYIQTEPKEGVYYNKPVCTEELLPDPSNMRPDLYSLRPYLRREIYEELLSYRDLSFDVKYACIEQYWKKERTRKDSFDRETSYVDSIPETAMTPNSQFKTYGNETIGADKIFWKMYKQNFPILSMMNKIFKNMCCKAIMRF